MGVRSLWEHRECGELALWTGGQTAELKCWYGNRVNHKEHSFAGVGKPPVERENVLQKCRCLPSWCGMAGPWGRRSDSAHLGLLLSIPYVVTLVQALITTFSWTIAADSDILFSEPSSMWGKVIVLWLDQYASLLRKL